MNDLYIIEVILMRRKILFLFLTMLFIIPFRVKADTYYFNYSDYMYAIEYIEESDAVEVEEIIDNDGSVIYKYRTRDYIITPDRSIVITNRNFDIYNFINTNIPLDEIAVMEYYDLESENYCEAIADVIYKDNVIRIPVYISIDNYIVVPEEIVVKDYNFDIYSYIETDIEVIEDIEIIGSYDLNVNGTYELTLLYHNTVEKTKIVVDINENNMEPTGDNIKNEVENKEGIISETSKIYETKNYVSNYYELKSTEDEKELITKVVPVNNRIICEHDDSINQYYFYISYAFYFIIVILLSIIVVRKK